MFEQKYIKYKNKYLKYKNEKIGGSASGIMASSMLGSVSNYKSPRSYIIIASDIHQAIYIKYYKFFAFDYLFLKNNEYTYCMDIKKKNLEEIKINLVAEINYQLNQQNETLLEDLENTNDNEIVDEIAEFIYENISKINDFKKLSDNNFYNTNYIGIKNTLWRVFHNNFAERLALPTNILDNIYNELYQPVSNNNQKIKKYTIKQWINDDTYNKYLGYLNELPNAIKNVLIERMNQLISSASGVPKWLIKLGYNHMASKKCDISDNSDYGCNLRETSINEIKYKGLPIDIQTMYIKKEDKKYYLNKTLESSINENMYNRLSDKYKNMYNKINNEYIIVPDFNEPLISSIDKNMYDSYTNEKKNMYIKKDDNLYNLKKIYIYRSLYTSCLLRKCYNLIV